VTLLARGKRAQSIRQHGITIKGLADYTVPVQVQENPSDITSADLLVLTVKTYDTESALHSLGHVEVDGAFSVQNGVLKDEQLARAFGPQATLGAAADTSAEVNDDGSVSFTRNEAIYLGELPQGSSQRSEAIVAMLEEAGIRAKVSQSIQTTEWSKFVAWISLTPLALCSRFPTHRILQDPDLALLHVTLVREVASLAATLGIELDDSVATVRAKTLSELSISEAIAQQEQMGAAMQARGITNHRLSALQDLERGRRLEVEETLGYALSKATEAGLSLPAVETCYRLMAGLARGVS